MDSLEEYRRKRDFRRTPEPDNALDNKPESGPAPGALRFVIQKHAAQNLHYDLRLEQDGVYKSWAVPKGPSLKPGEKRLAIEVENHPLSYGNFEGTIPKGEYGGGTVMIWDRGYWQAKNKRKPSKDRIDLLLDGEKLRGAWSLIRTAGKDRKQSNQWLLIKRSDDSPLATVKDSLPDQSTPKEISTKPFDPNDVSVVSGRTMEEIATGAEPKEATLLSDPAVLSQATKSALPTSIKPLLATLEQKAPTGTQWLHEIKFDGYRILARCSQQSTKLLTRNGQDWSRRFATLTQAFDELASKNAIIDGEVIALNEDGTSSFRQLQEALSAGKTESLIFQAFDLIYLNGYDLRKVPLIERKTALQNLLEASGFDKSHRLKYADHILGKGPEFSEHACRLGLEGIICKRADSTYKSGRSRRWLKIKCTAREEFVICGYTDPGGARAGFGALLLAAWHKDELVYVGRVGTGFSHQLLKSLHAQLKKLAVSKSPLSNPPKAHGLHWVKPALVAEVGFTNWTRDGLLRHPAFQGLREDRKQEDIQLPAAAQAANTAEGDKRKEKEAVKVAAGEKKRTQHKAGTTVAGVPLSSKERILYPEQGFTKLALAEYYEAIADWILPHIKHRPLSLVRCPDGYQKTCFFQKHPGPGMSKSIPRLMIEEKNGEEPYLYIDKLSDMIHLVQLGTLEFHVWGSTLEDIEHPDRLVFDLDPSPEVAFRETRRVAKALRRRLSDLGLNSFVRTTGGKGLHVVVPIKPEKDWDEVKAFCHSVTKVQARNDAMVTSVMSKRQRKGRIFMDYLRNGRGATAISSYSLRARAGAPVAVPIRWDEVDASLRPDRYTIENLRRRLAALKQDPWHDFEAARRKLSDKLIAAAKKAEKSDKE